MSVNMRALIDQSEQPPSLTVTAHDLPDIHEQLLAIADRGEYVLEAAQLVECLHRALLGFAGADPRAVSEVMRALLAALRRGPLRPREGGITRYNEARTWLANIQMRRREAEHVACPIEVGVVS